MLTINGRDLGVIEAALRSCTHASHRAAAEKVITGVREFISTPELLDEARELARHVEDEEDRISFDDEASTSPSDEGTFVSCWFWVPKPPVEEGSE